MSSKLKFSPQASPVRVRISSSDDPPVLNIDVSDAGPGIDTEVRAKLFRGARVAAGAGMGLGLYIVERVMALHKARSSSSPPGARGPPSADDHAG
ncbi:MAG: ATP-binding protein [Burkholderiaceae bacterium]